MRILALDLARRTGFALGEAGDPQACRCGAWTLAKVGEGPEAASRKLAEELDGLFQLFLPDLICVEHWLHPLAQPSADVAIMQLHLHGCLHGMAGNIEVVMPQPAEVRKHFCGRAFALPRTQGQKTKRQQAEARDATKRMVISRAVMLGYLVRGSEDADAADAAGLFDWASAHHGRQAPAELVLFGEAKP